MPPNTTAISQRLDHGIIRAFKARYRLLLLRRLFSVMDSSENLTNLTNLLKEINVKLAIDFAARAWSDLPESIIQNCFHKSGIWKRTAYCDEEIIDNNLMEQQNELYGLSNLMKQMQFDDGPKNFITFDDALQVFDGFEHEQGAEARRKLLEMGLADLAEAYNACDDELVEEEENAIDE